MSTAALILHITESMFLVTRVLLFINRVCNYLWITMKHYYEYDLGVVAVAFFFLLINNNLYKFMYFLEI